MDRYTQTTGSVGGPVPATLALTLGAAASFGAFTPAVAREYTATTTANVISTAGDATLTVSDPSTNHPGHLVNGSFFLPQPLQGLGTVKAYAPGLQRRRHRDVQAGRSARPTRCAPGSYSKTLTFTLSTTTP